MVNSLNNYVVYVFGLTIILANGSLITEAKEGYCRTTDGQTLGKVG